MAKAHANMGAEMRFEPSREGMKALARSAAMKGALDKTAADLARRAQANGGTFTKEYDTLSRMEDGEAVARAGTDWPFAHWDEWGTRLRSPRAPMRRALHEMGLWGKTKVKAKG